MDARDYDIARSGWIGDYMDPNTFLDLFVTDGGNNRTGWSNSDFDALIAAAANSARARRDPAALLQWAPEKQALRAQLAKLEQVRSPDAERDALARFRLELLRQAEALLVNRGFPVIPIYFYVSSGLIRPGIEGFYSKLQFADGTRGSNLQDLHPLRDLRMGSR